MNSSYWILYNDSSNHDGKLFSGLKIISSKHSTIAELEYIKNVHNINSMEIFSTILKFQTILKKIELALKISLILNKIMYYLIEVISTKLLKTDFNHLLYLLLH